MPQQGDITLAQLLSQSEGFTISASIQRMMELGYTPVEMEQVLQREFPGATSRTIEAAVNRGIDAFNVAGELQRGERIFIKDIPLSPEICAGSPGGSACRFVVTAAVCTTDDMDNEQWETVIIDTDEIPDMDAITAQVGEMLASGEMETLPGGSGSGRDIAAHFCGITILSVFRSY